MLKPDIHAGAVGPVRNGMQVGGLAGVLTTVATADPLTGAAVAVGGIILGAIGSAARAEQRKDAEAGRQPHFWRNLLLTLGALLG